MAKKPMTTKDRIREWISDNLRYMMLIAGILAVVGLILLAVNFLAGDNGKKEGGKGDTQITASSSSEEEPEADSSSALLPETSDSSSQPEQEEQLVFGEGNHEPSKALAETYFAALGTKDLDRIRSVVDELSEEEAAQIQAEEKVTGYDQVKVYTVNGPKEGTYIAFVSYNCTYEGVSTPLPMLSELYLYTNADGSLVIDNETESDGDVTAAMEEALQLEEAQNLLHSVQDAYAAAIGSDEQLKALVESIG